MLNFGGLLSGSWLTWWLYSAWSITTAWWWLLRHQSIYWGWKSWLQMLMDAVASNHLQNQLKVSPATKTFMSHLWCWAGAVLMSHKDTHTSPRSTYFQKNCENFISLHLLSSFARIHWIWLMYAEVFLRGALNPPLHMTILPLSADSSQLSTLTWTRQWMC